jgi:hypothetical protein
MLLLIALALEPPPPTELVSVSFSSDGRSVAVETRYTMEGPGFPVATLELWQQGSGNPRHWEVTLREDKARLGLEGASQAVRLEAQNMLQEAGIGSAAEAVPCLDGKCGVKTGCASKNTPIAVHGIAVPEASCGEKVVPERLEVEVGGKLVFSEAAPIAGCPSQYRLQALYPSSGLNVVLLSYLVPGHEGLQVRNRFIVY